MRFASTTKESMEDADRDGEETSIGEIPADFVEGTRAACDQERPLELIHNKENLRPNMISHVSFLRSHTVKMTLTKTVQ